MSTQTTAPSSRKWLLHIGIGIIVIYCLVPFYWMIVSAFRRPADVGDNSPLPSPWSLGNFEAVFGPSVGFWRALGNSVLVAASTTILTDRKSTRLNSSHLGISYAVFCLKK